MFDPNCLTCQAILKSQQENSPLKEHFGWIRNLAVYDIDKARQFVKQPGRIVYDMATEQLAPFQSYTGIAGTFRVLTTSVDERHIDHVPDSKDDPIIVGQTLKPRNSEESPRANMPIDGHHRIAKAVKHNHPLVYFYFLTEEETDQILTDNRDPLPIKKRKRK